MTSYRQPTALPLKKVRAKSIRRSRAQWEVIIARYKSGRLTQGDFCQQEGLTTSVFYKWLRLISMPAESEIPPIAKMDQFIEIDVPESTAIQTCATPALWDMELTLGNGIMLRVRNSNKIEPC